MNFNLSEEEKRIIKILYVANRPLSTNQVSMKVDMGWVTAKKYLLELRKKNIVIGKRKGKSIYWWLVTENNK